MHLRVLDRKLPKTSRRHHHFGLTKYSSIRSLTSSVCTKPCQCTKKKRKEKKKLRNNSNNKRISCEKAAVSNSDCGCRCKATRFRINIAEAWRLRRRLRRDNPTPGGESQRIGLLRTHVPDGAHSLIGHGLVLSCRGDGFRLCILVEGVEQDLPHRPSIESGVVHDSPSPRGRVHNLLLRGRLPL